MDESRDAREVLVIIQPGRPADTASNALESVEVRHSASPRVYVVAGPPDALAALRTTTGIHVLSADTDERTAPSGLDAGEVLFVEAWLSRQTPKTRPGEGLAWDAPGFEPPDVQDDTT